MEAFKETKIEIAGVEINIVVDPYKADDEYEIIVDKDGKEIRRRKEQYLKNCFEKGVKE